MGVTMHMLRERESEERTSYTEAYEHARIHPPTQSYWHTHRHTDTQTQTQTQTQTEREREREREKERERETDTHANR
jgi:hypothetical protein